MTEPRRLITAIEQINELVRVQRRLVQDLGREPTPGEIGKAMGIGADEVRGIQMVSQEPVSLEKPIAEEEESHLDGFIEDSDAVVPVNEASFHLLQDQLGSMLHPLSEREKMVIELRFGLADGHPQTLEEVGRELGVTSEQIRTTESEALMKLRDPSRPNGLGPRDVPGWNAGHLHQKPLDDFQLRSHLRTLHPRALDRHVPSDMQELRTMHDQLHREGPPTPA